MIAGNNGNGSRRSLDFDLNLTSFIDLLSTCTCFLLITAVWIQIGTIEIKQSHGTDAAVQPKEAIDLDLVFISSNQVKVLLKKNGKPVTSYDVNSPNHTALLADLNSTIATKVLDPSKKVVIGTATVTPKNGVNYGEMVQALDVLRKNKIVNIGVLTEKGQ